MISCDTKQQFSRVACGCGRTIDPGGRHGGTTGRDVVDDDDDDVVHGVPDRPTDKLHETTQFICTVPRTANWLHDTRVRVELST